ncbi:uncharacterized protein Z520_05338 [Fonsecaea multimorphosa CBS 102226]|uniref:EthD domain-containing protein n=1 Tax=Fonsecaea multimorphosa CBS 102226 TaxID=1442371 RepID=A0A0D2JZD6_9EURO|nr:uncharacterized protein Z520_05338 [Fonsecaea multimorphosa CBS 102226]KIX98877.1 hypothetical protein Z520_05338 [Fonsecaea multimorphosa CBS 102226]OAL25154.1 hypothetical protein AYO22_05031 [Fonsecaea multimorphosa]
MSAGRQPYIRVSIFIKRKPGTSSEEFHAHWSGIHADVVRSLPGYLQLCKRYTQARIISLLRPQKDERRAPANLGFLGGIEQFHALPEYQNQEKVMGLPVLPFDGIVEIWIESVDNYVQHVSQENIVNALAADEQKFTNREDAFIMIGYETLEIGEPVPGFA